MVTRGRVKRKPHTQIGQNRGNRGGRPKQQPPFPTGGLPFQAGQIPKPPPTIPNFLPNTAGFERGQRYVDDARSLAGSQYGITTGLIQPQLQSQLARLDTDQGLATRRLDEDMANRGVFTSGFRPTLYQEQIATPFGRQRQDLAQSAAQQYSQAGLDYANALLGAEQSMFDLYNDRANEAYDLSPLSVPTGGYQVPNQPGPYFSTPRPRGGGRTRPNRRGNRGGNRGRR